jgi:hypothetical protein
MTEATQEFILNVAFERESIRSILNKTIQEERLLAQIAELERARSVINGKYYYGRIEALCKEYEAIKNNRT